MSRLIVLTAVVLSSLAAAQSFEGLDLSSPKPKAPKPAAAPAPTPTKAPAASSTPAPTPDVPPLVEAETPPVAAPAAAPVEPAPVEPTPAVPEPADPGATPPPVATSTADAPAVEEPASPAFEVSLKGGVHLPQIANPLTTSFDALLKFGYGLPFWQRRVQLFVDLSYTQPSTSSTGSDARLPGGAFTSTTTVRDFATGFGASVFILPPSRPLVPYVSAGVRVHFLRAETDGEAAGQAFGPYQETDTRVGGVFAAGAGYRLGPGRVLLELAFNVLPVDQRLTGASNASSMSVLLGYGFFF